MFRFPLGIQEVGKCSNRAEFGVTSSAQEITLTTGKKSIEIIPAPTETAEIYFGGSGVAIGTGVPIMAGKIWANCKEGFSVYLITATTANVRICEYD